MFGPSFDRWSSLEQHAAPVVLALIFPLLLTLPQIIPLLITAKLHLKITNISIQLLSSSTHGYRGHVIIIIIKLVFYSHSPFAAAADQCMDNRHQACNQN